MTIIYTIANTPKATMSSHREGEVASTRNILRRAWNHEGALGVSNGRNRVVTPFRGVTNLGDFLNRKNYDIQTGGWRPLCLQEPPFNFPKPILVVNEDEIGEYSDKHMGLWRKEQIPYY